MWNHTAFKSFTCIVMSEKSHGGWRCTHSQYHSTNTHCSLPLQTGPRLYSAASRVEQPVREPRQRRRIPQRRTNSLVAWTVASPAGGGEGGYPLTGFQGLRVFNSLTMSRATVTAFCSTVLWSDSRKVTPSTASAWVRCLRYSGQAKDSKYPWSSSQHWPAPSHTRPCLRPQHTDWEIVMKYLR